MDEHGQLIREELDKIDFQKLNEVLAQNIDHYSIKFSKEISKLAKIVLTNYKDVLNKEVSPCTEQVTPNEVINRILDFFKEINPLYAYQFLNILSEKYLRGEDLDNSTYTVHFENKDDQKKNQKNISYKDGRINIVLEGTTRDFYYLVHEFVHKFTRPFMQMNIIQAIYGEVPSISIEFILFDYLSRVNHTDESYQKDIKSFIEWRISNSILSSFTIFIECKIIELFRKNHNRLDGDILFEYLKSLDDSSIINTKRMLTVMKKIIARQKLTYQYNFRYIIALLFACDFRVRIKENPSDLQSLINLNDLFGNSDDTFKEDCETLKTLGITTFGNIPFKEDMTVKDIINNEHFIEIDDETIERLTSSYKQVLSEFFGIGLNPDKVILPKKPK